VAASLQSGAAVIAFNGIDGLPLWMMNGTEVPWFFHADETVDIAILPMASLRLREYDYQDISTNLFITPERRQEYGIGIGDEVFTIGLFPLFFGDLRFTPMARTGIISMMPRGRLSHPVFGSIEAYLTESRSLGGLSGSPVFVRDTVQVHGLANKEGVPRPFSASANFHLLGMLSGHWDAPHPSGSETALNMGISLVVPAEKILEALFEPEISAVRKEAFDRGILPNAKNLS
jgi:hypothetical protein